MSGASFGRATISRTPEPVEWSLNRKCSNIAHTIDMDLVPMTKNVNSPSVDHCKGQADTKTSMDSISYYL
jgi:hypothetical protein